MQGKYHRPFAFVDKSTALMSFSYSPSTLSYLMALFRQQVVAAKQAPILGSIVLIRPLAFSLLTGVAVILASCVIAFLAWGSYTQRTTVSGQLVPEQGLLKIFAPQVGLVQEKRVSEAQSVPAGAVLLVLSSERQSSRMGATQAAISNQVEQRQASIREEMQTSSALQLAERNGIQQKISAQQQELAQLQAQISSQQDHVALSTETVKRYSALLAQDYVAREQWQQKQEELLEQTSRLQALQRDQTALRRELSQQQAELSALALKHKNQLAQLQRLLSNTQQELSESEAKRGVVITAPYAGIVTAVNVEVGQTVDASKPLLSIVPQEATLHAELYAPSRAIGFISPGDQVVIRYQAYPYQKFGHHIGVVQSVSKTALPPTELSQLGNVLTTPHSNEALYRIRVSLAQQAVRAYNQLHPLQVGMLLDADILQAKRHLYEWVLEPLYSLAGKL